jgi:hypothetical protein
VHTQAEIADGTKPFITVGKPGYKRKSWDTWNTQLMEDFSVPVLRVLSPEWEIKFCTYTRKQRDMSSQHLLYWYRMPRPNGQHLWFIFGSPLQISSLTRAIRSEVIGFPAALYVRPRMCIRE